MTKKSVNVFLFNWPKTDPRNTILRFFDCFKEYELARLNTKYHEKDSIASFRFKITEHEQ